MPDFVVVRDPVTETIEVATKGPKGDPGHDSPLTGALAQSISIGDSQATLITPPGITSGFIVVDPWSINCEVRPITSVAGNVVNTTFAFSKSHGAGATVYFTTANTLPLVWWGAPIDGVTDAEPAIQAAMLSCRAGNLLQTTGVWLTGLGFTYAVKRPVMMSNFTHLCDYKFSVPADYAPADPIGASHMMFRGEPQRFTAAASGDLFTTPNAHGLVVGDQVVLKSETGDTFPGGVTDGKRAFVKTVPSTTTFTLAPDATLGTTLDVTSDGVGRVYPNPQALCRVWFDDIYGIGSKVANVNGFKGNIQQPEDWGLLRFDKFDKGVWISGAASTPVRSLELIDNTIGLALDNVLGWNFLTLNTEQNDECGVKVLDATTVAGGGASNVDIGVLHSEQSTEGNWSIILEGLTRAFRIGNCYCGEKLLWNKTGNLATYRIDGPIRTTGTAGHAYVQDDQLGITRNLADANEEPQSIEVNRAQDGGHIHDDVARHAIYLPNGGYYYHGAVNPASHKRVFRPQSGQTGDSERWLDQSGNVVTSIDKDGNLITAQPWQDILVQKQRALATVITAAATYVWASEVGFVLPSTATAGIGAFRFDPAWYQLAGRTLSLRCIWGLNTNDVAPGITYTLGLYVVSAVAGTSTNNTITLGNSGNPIAGTTGPFTTPAADTIGTAVVTAPITAPSAGAYVLGLAASGAAAVGAHVPITARIQVRNV